MKKKYVKQCPQNWLNQVRHRYTHLLSREVRPVVFVLLFQPKSHTSDMETRPSECNFLWGCISANGVGDLAGIFGVLNAEKYRKIFIHHAIPSGKCMTDTKCIPQQDNDPEHNVIKNYLQRKKEHEVLEVMVWPPQRPDLKIMECVWDYMKGQQDAKKPKSKKIWSSFCKMFGITYQPSGFKDCVPRKLDELMLCFTFLKLFFVYSIFWYLPKTFRQSYTFSESAAARMMGDMWWELHRSVVRSSIKSVSETVTCEDVRKIPTLCWRQTYLQFII